MFWNANLENGLESIVTIWHLVFAFLRCLMTSLKWSKYMQWDEVQGRCFLPGNAFTHASVLRQGALTGSLYLVETCNLHLYRKCIWLCTGYAPKILYNYSTCTECAWNSLLEHTHTNISSYTCIPCYKFTKSTNPETTRALKLYLNSIIHFFSLKPEICELALVYSALLSF